MVSEEPAVGFGRLDGLPDAPIDKLFRDHAGKVYISTRASGLWELGDRRALPIKWSQSSAFNAIGPRICQDAKGDWWVGTGRGLFWFRGPDLAHARGKQITAAEGGPETGIVGEIYEDPQGKVWFGDLDNNLFCIERLVQNGRPSLHRIPLEHRFPYRRMIGDRSGGLWLAAQNVLSRVVEGTDRLLQPVRGLPEVDSRALFLDSRGWLWIGLRYQGVSVTKEPGADSRSFFNYSTSDGLTSNTVWSITEDSSGRIYFGTGRGLNRFDPSTGRISYITAGEKLVGDALWQCLSDLRGNIWVSTANNVVKLEAGIEPVPSRPPPIYLTKLEIAGEAVPLPEAGTVQGPSLTLGSSNNNLLVEYVGLDFHSDHELKYQYKLDGADADWSAPNDQRSVNYASLGPGSYHFMVRAVNQDGIVSPEPAVVQFKVLPPIWRQWWFVLAAVTMVVLAAFAAHRYRVSRLMELLTVRAHIASDLHDDIGSNLTKIAILSEVAQQQSGSRSTLTAATESPLANIARISRESVASMSDIVWAIDPRRDTQNDLVRRMRQFAIDMLDASGTEVQFAVTGDDLPRRVGPDFRRQVFLIFKEAVHNAARHSGCSKAEIEIKMERNGLTLTVLDNGTGFDVSRDSDGQGLASMQRRAQGLNGAVKVNSSSQGTIVTLMVPWPH